MNIQNEKIAKELLNHLHLMEDNDEFQSKIASIISELENSGICENMITEQRIKGPFSTLRKYENSGDKKYQRAWNAMRDLYGIMLIVDSNKQVDQFLSFMREKYSEFANNNMKDMITDYRKQTNRKIPIPNCPYIYQDPTNREYQTNNSYKSAKANLIIDGVPIEIQVKTKAQYIAHTATHDTIYKLSSIEDKATRFEVADKLFPYFETFAYLRLNRENLSQKQIEQVENDIKEIYQRNFSTYNKYPTVFNESRSLYGVNFYLLENRQKFVDDAIFGRNTFNLQLARCQIKQVYEYLFDSFSLSNPSLKRTEIVNYTVDKLLKLPYDEYKSIRQKIAGEYRSGGCILTGDFDVLKPNQVKLFEELSNVYKEVNIGVWSDELYYSFFGKNPIFGQETRRLQVEKCKGVTSSIIVEDINYKIHNDIGPLQFDIPEKKKYDLAYVSGVFDGFHLGHSEHLQTVINEAEKVYVGVKTDNYSLRVKNKQPINNEQDRLTIINSVRGIDKVFLTQTDMLPPKKFLDEAEKILDSGGKVAIYLGSDWQTKLGEKPESSLEELEYIFTYHPRIHLDTTTRTQEDTLSSTRLREKLKEAKNQRSAPMELKDLGEAYAEY